jgi:hypothetical protein
MSYRQARYGATLAGTLLLGMPVMEVALGLGTPGATHVLAGSLGIGLLAAAWSRRLR